MRSDGLWAFILAAAALINLPALGALPEPAPVPGGVALVPVPIETPERPHLMFHGHRVLVARSDRGWTAVVGLPLSLSPGRYVLEQHTAEGAGEAPILFDVGSKDYTVQRLTIPDRRKVEPSAEDMRRIRREQPQLDAAKNHWSAYAPADLALQVPAAGRMSSSFGLRRVFNGQSRNPHAGMDIAMPSGTPVAASAAGTVLATGDFFFNGNTVFVDHGQGFITMYCHLSRIDARPGATVARGDAVGLSGMTGRATGPHLHWSVILNGAMVDPALFIGDTGGVRSPP